MLSSALMQTTGALVALLWAFIVLQFNRMVTAQEQLQRQLSIRDMLSSKARTALKLTMAFALLVVLFSGLDLLALHYEYESLGWLRAMNLLWFFFMWTFLSISAFYQFFRGL